ncbi:MAG: PQQ-binding-like beta-propeller repeat protein, partial [Candidatus Aenigmarchaeota archaeon]|nr:PQQ-binding-like beta-propeller repeat protein [Candidatus Aenigmarchaeota archaeon]
VSTAGAGDLIINNSEISAVGSTAGTAPRAAVRVESANSLSLTRTTISTSGTGKDGVFAKSASAVIVDSSITTAGIDSRGVLLNDILSFAILNSTIITQNDGSDGIKVVSQNIPPSQAGNISWNQITTSGDNAPGISLISTEAALNSNIITTGGADSHGIYSSSSTLTASSNEMSTVGDVSHGFYLVSQSLYSLLENIISTTGDGSHGLYSSSPLDNSIAVENSISTSAIDAIPLYIYNTDKSTFDLNELKNDKQSVPMLLRLSTANRFADTLLGVNLSASPLPAIFNSEQGSYNNLITRISAGSIQLSFEATDVIIALAAPPTSPQGYSHLGRALDIRANSLSSNALLKFHYSEQELGNLDENKMKIWRYANGVWTDSGFSAPGQNGVNAQANFAFANITSFSVFAPLIEGTISCPAVPQPQCASGSPVAIRDESGCIASYECVSCSSSSTRGDLNGDGKIDEKDVAAASSIAAGQSPAPQNSCCIDIATPTGGITTDDVIAISRISSGSYGSAGTCSAPENPVENAPKGWIGFKRNKERTSYNPVGGPIKNIVIWTKSVGSEIRSSPVVLNDRVYIGSANAIHALDARTGNITWSFQTGSPVHSTPAVSTNGIVFAGSSNNKIYALNASNGNKSWEYATGGAVESSPLLHGGIVYAGSNDSKIYALNASSGTKVWEYATGDKVVSSPAFYRGVIFIGSNDNRTYALNASTGTHIWNQTTGGRVRSTPALHKGIVYVGSDDSRIYAFITRDGRKLWEHDAGSPVSSPAILERNNGDMIATGSASKTHILNITGQEIVAIPTVVPSAHSPATADKIYATAGNKLYAIDPGVQGYVVWSLDVGNSASSPAISGTVLYTANLSGNVYAIGELPPSTTVACNSNSARGDLNGDGRVDSIDVELADSVEAGDVAKPSNLCCIDINVLGGDGNVTTNDVEVITKIATGITTGAGTCSLPETPVIIGGIICQSPGGWSACEQNADGSFSRTRTVYVGSSCSPTAEEEGCLPTSCTQQSSEWGTCTGGTQSRTVYSPNPATFRCEAQQQSRSCISAETALQAINELRQEIENAKARGADPEIISLAESLLSQAEEAYDSGDYGLAYQKAQDGLTLIRGATVPESAIDPLWLALLIILLIILILLIIGYILAGREEEPNKVLYYVFYPGYVLRKRKGREESGNRCSICGQPTVIKQKCSVCGRTTCALHTISAGGRTYCPDHKPATRAVSGGAAATKTQAAAPPSNIPRTRRKKMRFLLRRPKK